MIHSYPWYIADWRGSEAVLSMTLAERGLYRELLDHCWESGNLPNSEVVLIKIARCSEKEFRKAWPSVSAQFYEKEGRLYHVKVDEKRRAIEEWHDSRRLAGRKGGLAKAASSARSSARAQPQAELYPSTSTSTSTTSEVEEKGNTHTQTRVREKPTDLNGHTSQRFEEFWNRWPRQTGKDAAATAWCSYVSIESEGKVFACLTRFLNSGDVERGAIPMLGPSNGKSGWLADCARDDWNCNWPSRKGNQEPPRMMFK